MRLCVSGGVILALVSCRAANRATNSDSTGATPQVIAGTSSVPQSEWRTFQGDGFTLKIPLAATTDTATSHSTDIVGIGITGPMVRNGTGQGGPAWKLVIASQPNRRNLSLDQWVDSVRNERNAASAGDPDSLAWMAAPDTMSVGEQRALRLQPFCGDCEAYEIYAAVPARIVVVAIIYDISIPGDREQQRAMYHAILATFRPASGASLRPPA